MVFKKSILAFIQKHKRYPSFLELQNIGINKNTINKHGGVKVIFRKLEESNPEIKEFKAFTDKSDQKTRLEIQKRYIELTKKLQKIPKLVEITSNGVCSATAVHRNFGSISGLHNSSAKIDKSISKFGRDRHTKTDPEFAVDDYYRVTKKLGRYPSFTELSKNDFVSSSTWIAKHFGSMSQLKDRAIEKYPDIKDLEVKNTSAPKYTKEEIIEAYINVYNKIGYAPTLAMLKKLNFIVSESTISRMFGGIKELESESRKSSPDQFSNITIGALYSKEKIQELSEDLKKYKRFLITTAVTGCSVHKPTYESLKTLSKNIDAKLLIILCSDPAKPKSPDDDEYIDASLVSETIVFQDIKLNNNLHIDTFKTSAKQIKPTTGMGRITKKSGSMVFASPKFFLEYVSVRNAKDKLARCLMTTGGVTAPDYNAAFYMAQRTAKIATYDHTFGAVYVEIENSEIYHFRQIEIRNDRGILFFGNKKIQGNKIEKIRPEAIVLGDLHVGATDPAVEKTFMDVINKYRPLRIFIHDGLDGFSINHWLERKFIELVRRAKENLDNLEQELDLFCAKMTQYASKCEKLIIVPSNHNDWLEDWINSGRFMKDYRNAGIGIKLADAMINHNVNNPLKYYYENMYKGKKLENIQWLGRNEDYFINDVQLNCHGDVGLGGTRGSLQSMENAYVASVSGHGHLAAILRDAWRTGTMTFLQEGYNNGPGPWTNTGCLLYEFGCRSLINHINGSKNGFYSEKY